MADFQGKRPFLWAQHSQVFPLDSTDISALSNWQLAISRTKTNPNGKSAPLCSFVSSVVKGVFPRLRGECQIGGRP